MGEGDEVLPATESEEQEEEKNEGDVNTPTIQAPTMGGLGRQSDGTQIAWTGGEPKSGWTGLVDPMPPSVKPTQYRPTSIGSSTKSQYYRTAGLSAKFSRKSDLQTFQKEVFAHLKKYGMDSITYLPSPTNDGIMITVVSDHARYTLDEATELEEDRKELYDFYDYGNISDAREFLLDSVDEDLKKQLYESCDDEDTFIVYWMNLMLLIGSVSVDRFERMKNILKACKLSQYSGHDVSSLCSDYLTDWKKLHGASMYDQKLTLHMVKTIMEGGNEDFRYELRGIKKDLDAKLLAIRYQPYESAQQEMVKAKLDVRTVLKKAKEEYRKLLDDDKWPAAAHARDSKAMNRLQGSVNAANSARGNKKCVNALDRSDAPQVRDKSNDCCNNCGELGHWANECPNRAGGRAPFNSPMRKGQRKGGNKPSRNFAKNNRGKRSKFPPPGQGDSEVRTDNSGTKWYWCAKCRRWTKTHSTATHQSKEELARSNGPGHVGMARIDFNESPCAYMAQARGCSANRHDYNPNVSPLSATATLIALIAATTGDWSSKYILAMALLLKVIGGVVPTHILHRTYNYVCLRLFNRQDDLVYQLLGRIKRVML